jgi:AraC-like DNA-binding protein
MVAPSSAANPGPSAADTTLVKALARAFRWRRMMEAGGYGTIDDLAAAAKINESYVSRLLRLTLLAPDIVEAILDGRQPVGITLPALMEPFPVEWEGQRQWFCARGYLG